MNNGTKTKTLTYIAITNVLNCICSWITVPFAIPFTLQTFSIFFTLFFLGGIKGTISIIIYILLGLVGVPVFSGFNSGIAAFLGPSGGYLIGFVVLGILYSIFTIPLKNSLSSKLISSFLGLLVCYTIGTMWYVYIYLNGNIESASMVLLVCIVPYIIPDIIKICLAYYIAKKTNSILERKSISTQN